MKFMYCNWLSNPWQWSLNLYTNRKLTIIYLGRNSTQNNTKTIKKSQNAQNRKQKHKTKTTVQRILRQISRVIKNSKEKQIIMR